MFTFNRSGLLVPAAPIPCTLDTLEQEFVQQRQTVSRTTHFQSFLTYANALKELCGGITLLQWIDGSFVTKAPEPGDIDLVTFLDYQVVEQYANQLKSFIYPSSEDVYFVDAYIVTSYPVGHERYTVYLADKLYWHDLFTKTRRNRAGNSMAKGFLEIVF